MADPFQHVSPNDPLVIQAATWNTLIDVARATSTGAGPGLGLTRQGSIVRVKNQTGAALARNAVVGLGDPIFTPGDASKDAFLREVTFRGLTPDISKHKRRFAVLIDPIPVDKVARAYVAGTCMVKVDVQHPSHEYAGIADGVGDSLTSSRYGFAQILWREGDEGYGYGGGYDTGPQWAVVRLGAHCPSVAIGKASGAISARSGTTFGTGTVDLYNKAGVLVESVDVMNASNALMTSPNGIDAGAWVSVAWDMDGTAWVASLECAADA